MLPLFRRNSSSRLIVVVTMILGLLLAQGLRVCVHGAAEEGVFSTATGVTHLESNLMTDDSDGATSPDWHAPFSIVLKQLGIKFELLAIAVALLILPLLQVVRQIPAPRSAVAPLASFHALRPPLRAPPL